MVSKGLKGRGFGGVLRYVHADPVARPLLSQHLGTRAPREAARLMATTALASARCRQPVYHVAVRLAPTDRRLTDSEWRDVATTMLNELGLADHQAVGVLHGDHLHLVVNRVGPDGRAAPLRHDYAAREQVCRVLEARYGLREVEGPHSGRRQWRRGETDGERRQAARTGRQSMTQRIGPTVAQAWADARDGADLLRRLDAAGLRLARGDRRGHVVVGRDGRCASLTRLVPAGPDERRARLGGLQLPLVVEAWAAPLTLPAEPAPARRAWSAGERPRTHIPGVERVARRVAGHVGHTSGDIMQQILGDDRGDRERSR
ncbi:MAG TPA: relaxase/mobilization nuclease domain-containing protein [Azospirillum sp.]|nr:relaxase/mobilization nuclease domain-containing protein [Azospirillum sp.]